MTTNIKESRIKTLLKRTKGENREVLFHHRFSTSTADVPNACHPFSTKSVFTNQYIGVHNGVLMNENELEAQHIERGITYVSKQNTGEFNDSEALIYDIARYLEGEVSELTAKGSIAFVIIKRNPDGKATNVFFGRNSGNPLVMKKTKSSLTLSSQGEGESIKTNTLYSYDYDTGALTERFLYIPQYHSNSYGTSKSTTTYGRNQYDSYDDYYNNKYSSSYKQSSLYGYEDTDDYYDSYSSNYYTTAEKIIEKNGYSMRSGTQSKIEADILRQAKGDFDEASIIALTEADEADIEMRRINNAIYSTMKDKEIEKLEEYWYRLNAYTNTLVEIMEKFENLSVKINNESIKVNDDERCLLPLAVTAGNV